MAKSLDDLVDFLLDEIALDSGRGASLKDIIRYTRGFYVQPYNEPTPTLTTHLVVNTLIDKTFISQVWRWLVTHDDLRIGRNNEYRDASLDQIEAAFPDILNGVFDSSDQPGLPTDDITTTSNSVGFKTAASQRRDSGPRIYASDYRVYHAVCGHEPDPSRISELEFSLLCTTGAARHEGILQGELGRVTKQDKRSVPKRTDGLQAKGYLVKQAAYHNGHKTSRILLRRFADTQPTSDTTNPTLQLGDVARQILTVLKENSFTTPDDLASQLSFLDPVRRQVLNHVVHFLVRKGCIKRVKVAFAPDSTSNDLRLTLQFVRALETIDYDNTEDDSLNLNTSLATAVDLITEGLDDGEESGIEIDPDAAISDTPNSNLAVRPAWNPDRALPNAIYDLAAISGDEGISNVAVRQHITGLIVRRPAESLLVRLSHAVLKARPLLGRDLALVRTAEVENGVHRFVHRTLDNYHDMVDRDSLTWSAADGGKDYAKRLDTHPANSAPQFPSPESFGFPHYSNANQYITSARPTIEDISNVPGPDTAVIVRPGEAIVVKDQAGHAVLSHKSDQIDHRSPRRSHTPQRLSCVVTLKLNSGLAIESSEPVTAQESTFTKSKPRPRNFPHGTLKFWSHIFRMTKNEIDPAGANVKQAILMNDPDCLQTFANRPEKFDSFLLRALKAGLPMPRSPNAVNEAWVSTTKAFLDRTCSGLFYMPSGPVDLEQGRWSCPVIIKSNRINELDMTYRMHRTSVLFITSSAAHTSRLCRVPKWYNDSVENVPVKTGQSVTANVPADEMISSSTTIQERQDEADPTETPPPITPQKDSLIVTLVVARPTSRRPSNMQSRASNTRRSPRMGLNQSERGQRQRRPTKKASESAQVVVTERYTPETSSSSVATPQDVESILGNVANATLPPGEDDLRSKDPLQNGNGVATDPVRAVTDFDANVKQISDSRFGPMNDQNPTTLDSVTARNFKASVEEERNAPKSDQSTQALDSLEEHANLAQMPTITREAEGYGLPQNDRNDLGASSGSPTSKRLDPEEVLQPVIEDQEPLLPSSRNTSPIVDPSRLTLLTGKDAVPYYRKFLVELVYMCGGVVPHDPSLLKRAMGPKSIEAHVEANMNIKIIKTSLGAMTQSGKLKVMQFAFQRNGFNHTKSILALPSVQPTDEVFTSMQAKISSLPVSIDYVPPELEIEATRQPLGILRTGDAPAPEKDGRRKPTIPARPKRQKKQSEPTSRRGSTDLVREYTPLEVSVNTGFLTLKVPKIAEIKTDQLFASKYFELPAQPVIVDTNLNGLSETGFPTAPPARRSGRFSTAARKVQWRTPKYTPLPTSLRAILANDHRTNVVNHALSINPSLETFDKDVDFVAEWEQKTFDDLQEPKRGEWNFINHLSHRKEFVDTRGEGDLIFFLLTFNNSHEEVEKKLPEAAESWDVFANIISKEAKKAKKADEKRNKRKRKTQVEFEGQSDNEEDGYSDFMSSDGEAPKKKRQRGPNHKWRRKPRIAGTELDRRRQKRMYVNPRGIGLRDIPKALAHRITTAIVVVRVLAGGLDKYLDWKIVARLIPGEPESVLHSRWRTLSTRYNNDFDAMVQDLQTKYLDALADDRVPSVNYNDLPGTDWEGIFEWAVVNINADDKGTTMIELPPNREEFLELHTAEVAETTSVRPLHNNSLQYTQATKEDFWCSVVFGTTANSLPVMESAALEHKFLVEEDEAGIRLARARSWVFAAVMTPHQSFDPQLTHEKLRKLADNERECEELIDSTIRKLQDNKMVVTKDSTDAVIQAAGNTLSGTYHWKLSTKFMDKFELNRHITANMLKQAVKYKTEVLDPAFARGEVVTIPGDPYLEDGVMVAIFNLMNTGMMRLEPGADMTANRYGVDGGREGYKTRSMDKRHLFFTIFLTPTGSYVQGDLLISERSGVRIPRGDLYQADGMGLIPMWFDINHKFRPDIWEMIVGAVTGLISCRPGVSTLELVRSMQHVMTQRDMAMIVQYLFDCKAIQKTRSGWETTESWWFAVGTGTGIEDADVVENGV